MAQKELDQYRKERKAFIRSVKKSLKQHIKAKDLEPYFFNWYQKDDYFKENKAINEYINSSIPGVWEMTDLWGNGTNVGEGVFWNDEYCLELHLSCFDKYEEAIDDYYIEGE